MILGQSFNLSESQFPDWKIGPVLSLRHGMVRAEMEDDWRPCRVLTQSRGGAGAGHLGSNSCLATF